MLPEATHRVLAHTGTHDGVAGRRARPDQLDGWPDLLPEIVLGAVRRAGYSSSFFVWPRSSVSYGESTTRSSGLICQPSAANWRSPIILSKVVWKMTALISKART